MKIAMTGATGFLGSKLVEHMAQKGHQVVGLTRDPTSAQRQHGNRCEWIPWPSPQSPIPDGTFDNIDAVIHLAGESVNGRWTKAKRKRILDSRQEGTRRVVEAIKTATNPPSHLLSSSAIGYYGDRADTPLTEESGRGDIFLSDVCVCWEEEAQRAQSESVKVSLLRTGLVLDPNGGALGEMMPLFRKGLGGKLGSGRQMWSWIHREDWIRAIDFILESEADGPINVVGPSPVSQKEFAKTLASVLKRPSFLPAPSFALKAVLGGFASEVLTSKKVIPKKLTDAGFVFNHPILREALEELLRY